jgi:hypothetical protein
LENLYHEHNAGDVVLMQEVYWSYGLSGIFAMAYSIFIAPLSFISGYMRCGGVWFWYVLLVMIPWFVGLLVLFGVVRVFRDIGNRLSSIAIMLVDMVMVQGVIRLVNEQMYVEARGLVFGRITLSQNLLMQVGLLFTVIIVCYSVFIVFERLAAKV